MRHDELESIDDATPQAAVRSEAVRGDDPNTVTAVPSKNGGQLRNSVDPLSGKNVEFLPIESLIFPKRQLRTHSEKQLTQLAASIRQFGFIKPVLIDEHSSIIAGVGCVWAAERLGMTSVPTLCVSTMTDVEKRAFAIADNKLALSAGWDEELLAIEFGELIELDGDFQIELTGFDTVEIDHLTIGPSTRIDPADSYPPAAECPAVSRVGDLFELGAHRLVCGDALNERSYQLLLGDEKAQMVFTDVPFNVRIDGHASGNGRIKHRPFVMASGEMSTSEFRAFLGASIKLLAAHSIDGAIQFHCMDHRHICDLLDAARPIYGEHKNLCVWNKTNAGMGTFYRSKHELIVAFKVGSAAHINNFGLGERGRYRTNVWDYAGVNTFRSERADELAMHPTVKPVALVADAIRDCSHRDGTILDGFGGSGTTLIASEKTKRRARLIELDPLYCDTIVRRFERFTKQQARHVETGMTFAELQERRSDVSAT